MVFLNGLNSALKYDFQDFSIVPNPQTNITTRKDIKITLKTDTNYNTLPLFVAPMDSVIDYNNLNCFIESDLRICLPRQADDKPFEFGFAKYISKHGVFYSVGLNQFRNLIYEKHVEGFGKFFVLLDIANGHIEKLVDYIKDFKQRYPKAVLMVGNIAHPKTFGILGAAGADYIRVGIGGGQACTTSANVAIHFPIASLIKECLEEKNYRNLETKIVADGGFKNFDDIIKALALGADYVMIGSLFNKTIEACGQAYLFDFIPVSNNIVRKIFSSYSFLKPFITRKYRGMSTKEVQKSWNKKKLTTSEGVVKYNKVEYSLDQWCNNFKDYLKSAMSYSNATDLKEFKEGSLGVFITSNSFKRFSK